MASTVVKKVVHESNGKLYEALLEEDTKEVLKLCADKEDHALHILTIHQDTVLHKAAYSKQADLVFSLLKDLPPCHDNKLRLKNHSGNTILHEAATLSSSDHEISVKVAEEMIKRDQELLRMRNELGETPLFRAARYGKSEIFNFLAGESLKLNYGEKDMQQFVQRDDKTTILHIAILSQHFGLALKIARDDRFRYLEPHRPLVGKRDEDGMTTLQLLSCNPKAFEPVRRRGFLKRISIKMCGSSAESNDISKEELSHESALELAKLLVKEDTSWEITSSGIDTSKPRLHKYESTDVSTTNENVDNPDQLPASISLQEVLELGGITPLFLATKSGCIEIVREILEIYPQAVEHIDNDGRTILHVAIKYRQLEVFKHVLGMEVAMRWLVRRLDNGGNSILHMVGKKRKDYVPEKLRGPALELQEELLWFERVKSVTKAHFIDHRNKEKLTAEGLFAKSNTELRNAARDWLKHTAEGCSIVAVLIATVAFAAAYTIPGGPNQNTGVPVLLNDSFFVVFTATDVLSLTCALTSVVIFLSILTAPFRLEDFKHSLPNKLMLGFTFLFLSVSMMMISFSATIILMIRSKERWTKILLYSLSFLPVGIFALAYFPLYLSLSKTYKYLLMKIMEAFPCRSSSLRLQGGSNNNSCRDNSVGERCGCLV
ncbi:uncharacterized protein LOC115989803 isoform X2 [Quercus lobata]|uniref:uncharacterized protein LOC115989803 isoform X2 n=1 Tax=Quercus lobata TaxID=97700 RepID=UPI001245FE1B|nr:uncharacterized protein LOC115989803 isoform X2 [Quercus lobata]